MRFLRPLAAPLFVVVLLAFALSCAPAGPSERPTFRLESLTGEEISPTDFPGEIVVLDFWATWCVPCRAQAEILDKVHSRWADRGVRFLAVNVEEPEETVRAYVRENPFPYPVLLDTDYAVSAAVELQALPTVMVVGPEGDVVFSQAGVVSGEELEKVIREARG